MLFPEAERSEMAYELLRRACLEPTLRPAELTIPHFRALADAYSQLCAQQQGLASYDFREEQRLKRLQRKPAGSGGGAGGGKGHEPPPHKDPRPAPQREQKEEE